MASTQRRSFLFNSTVESPFCLVCPWDGSQFVRGTIVLQGLSGQCLCVLCLLVVFTPTVLCPLPDAWNERSLPQCSNDLSHSLQTLPVGEEGGSGEGGLERKAGEKEDEKKGEEGRGEVGLERKEWGGGEGGLDQHCVQDLRSTGGR